MNRPVKTGATYDDLVDLPENVVGELIGGELWVTPRPRVRHGFLQFRLARDLDDRLPASSRRPDGWWFLPEPELHLDETVVVPDLAGWRVARMPALDPSAAFVTLAPDWICEIVSPSTARLDRVVKLPIYALAGVAHAWIVDPEARTLELLRRDDAGRWIVTAQHAGDERVRPEPFDAAEIDLTRWWLPDAPAPSAREAPER